LQPFDAEVLCALILVGLRSGDKFWIGWLQTGLSGGDLSAKALAEAPYPKVGMAPSLPGQAGPPEATGS
jgi:hypothetical protein